MFLPWDIRVAIQTRCKATVAPGGCGGSAQSMSVVGGDPNSRGFAGPDVLSFDGSDASTAGSGERRESHSYGSPRVPGLTSAGQDPPAGEGQATPEGTLPSRSQQGVGVFLGSRLQLPGWVPGVRRTPPSRAGGGQRWPSQGFVCSVVEMGGQARAR